MASAFIEPICATTPAPWRYSPRSAAPPNSFAHTQTSCCASRGTPGTIGGARRTNYRDQRLIIIATDCSFTAHDPQACAACGTRQALADPGRLLVPSALADPDRLLLLSGLSDPDRLLLLFRRAAPPDPAVLVGPNRQRVGNSQAPLRRLLSSFVPPLSCAFDLDLAVWSIFSGSFAKFAAIRRASSRVSQLCRRLTWPSKNRDFWSTCCNGAVISINEHTGTDPGLSRKKWYDSAKPSCTFFFNSPSYPGCTT